MKLEPEGGKGSQGGARKRARTDERFPLHGGLLLTLARTVSCALSILFLALPTAERVSPRGHGETYRGSSARTAVFESVRLTLKPPPEIATISTIVEARLQEGRTEIGEDFASCPPYRKLF